MMYRCRIAALLAVALLLGILPTGCVSAPLPGESPVEPVEAPPYTAQLTHIEELVERQLSTMTLAERIGQRLIVFVPRAVNLRTDSGRATFKRTLFEIQPAGVMLYPWNYESAEDVVAITSFLQTVAERLIGGRRLVICADQEGGRVAGFRFSSIVRLPPARAIGALDDPRAIWAAAYLNGLELRRLGITMNLAPVVDITDAPPRSIIGDRAWSADAHRTADYARAAVDAYRQVGIIATAKHFPGHGVTTVDSHGRLPTVNATWEELRDSHVVPFAAAIAAGVPAIMTAHILFPQVDPRYPATISEQFLVRHLREELGFQGVIISDGLEMGALAKEYDLDLTLERALRFGVDLILLYASYDPTNIAARISAMIADGRVSEAELDAGVRRVLTMKAAYGLLAE